MQTEYRFQSRTNPEITYVVKRDSGNWFCSCPAAYHGKECWHLKKVLAEQFFEDLNKVKGPDINFQNLIQEQWEYINQRSIRRHF